ncbi:MAG: response regulator [Chloroflexi bacterium]|nr:response regulator [Chloroflexota bacterium]
MMPPTASILIVDDTPAGRDTLEELLLSPDYRLTFAANGPEALAHAARLTPDLILLDVMMPGMDGFEVCRRLRADPRLAEVPVVMITALDDRDSRLQGLEAGGDDFITKPFDRAELRARIRTITRLNRYRRLLAERTRFDWVVEQSNDGYVLVGEDDTIIYANPQARFYLGFAETSSELIGKKFLAQAQKQYQCEPDTAWVNWPTQAISTIQKIRYLVRPESATSRAYWLQVTVLNQPAGLENQYLIHLRDVTAEINFQRNLRTFEDAISHKMRTPLTHILAGLEMLAEVEELSLSGKDVAKFATLALNGARRLQGEIEDILGYLSVSKMAQAETGFSLAELGQVVAKISENLGLASVRLSGQESLEMVQLALSLRAFEWILREILANAKKFHPHQSPTIEIITYPNGHNINLQVVDDGLTLSPEQLSQVWKPYYQGEKYFTGEAAGMGLGLSTVASLVWEVGGTCRLYNRDNEPGVVVELIVPTV